MPLFLQKKISPGVSLAVWHITESNGQLKQLLGNSFFEHDMEKKMEHALANHYLASRVLLAQSFGDSSVHLHKNNFNKPLLEINGRRHFVSITHSHHYAAIIFSELMEVGIDLELIDKRINRVAHKFINEAEAQFACGEEQVVEKTLIWSAKETLYKIYGARELDFREHLHISRFSPAREGTIATAIIKNAYNCSIPLSYLCFGDYVLTYAMHEPNTKP